jgi:hypothetical protein
MSAVIYFAVGAFASSLIWRRLNSVEGYEHTLYENSGPGKFPYLEHSTQLPKAATGNINYHSTSPAERDWLGNQYHWAQTANGRKIRVYLNHTSADNDNFTKNT